MIIWINGGFGAGKTTAAEELHRRLADADEELLHVFLEADAGVLGSGSMPA